MAAVSRTHGSRSLRSRPRAAAASSRVAGVQAFDGGDNRLDLADGGLGERGHRLQPAGQQCRFDAELLAHEPQQCPAQPVEFAPSSVQDSAASQDASIAMLSNSWSQANRPGVVREIAQVEREDESAQRQPAEGPYRRRGRARRSSAPAAPPSSESWCGSGFWAGSAARPPRPSGPSSLQFVLEHGPPPGAAEQLGQFKAAPASARPARRVRPARRTGRSATVGSSSAGVSTDANTAGGKAAVAALCRRRGGQRSLLAGRADWVLTAVGERGRAQFSRRSATAAGRAG